MSKFDSKLAETLYDLSLDGGQDEDIGSVSELGWFGRFNYELAILSEDSLGFVNVETFKSELALRLSWEDIERDYELFDRGIEPTF